MHISMSSFIPCLITLAILVQLSHAQNNPQDYVNAHNSARAAVGVGNIQWDETVANYARNYANQRIGDCGLRHSGGQYGENIFMTLWPGDSSMTGVDAVNLWVNEKANYHYDTNTCDPNKVCGHYTQVVWRNSVRLGCARVQCNSGGTFITCNYDPPGNYVGQKPY